MLTACATLVSESSSLECSSMNLRAFQISTGSARSLFCNLACLDSCVGDIFITPKPVNAGWSEDAHHPLSSTSLILGTPGTLGPSRPSNFCNEKAKRCKASCGAIASLGESHGNLWKKISEEVKTNAIPNRSLCPLDDGAVCTNHCAMFQRAGMAIAPRLLQNGSSST